MQSFNNTELKKLSRIHDSQAAINCIRALEKAGFKNISLDLMYGIPLQTMESWQETLKRAIDLEPQHISLYGLKVEPNTSLEKLVDQGHYIVADDDLHVEMYEYAIQYLEENGLYQYEFSNFARPGFESRHNLNYWNNKSFWAFGPSAHGYINNYRYENPRDLKQWLDDPLSGSKHHCTDEERLENAFIFGLRKTMGVDIKALEREFGFNFMDKYGWILTKYADQNIFKFNNNNLSLENKAIKISNEVLAEFIQV